MTEVSPLDAQIQDYPQARTVRFCSLGQVNSSHHPEIVPFVSIWVMQSTSRILVDQKLFFLLDIELTTKIEVASLEI